MEVPDFKGLEYSDRRYKEALRINPLREKILTFLTDISWFVKASSEMADETNMIQVQKLFAIHCEAYEQEVVFESLRLLYAKVLGEMNGRQLFMNDSEG